MRRIIYAFIFCIFIVILLIPAIFIDAELKPFTTDGCSSFPDGTLGQQSLWHNCCVRHDIKYWQGGTYEQRSAADQELQQCVAKVGEPKIANLMLAGVRVGGSPYWPMPYRWGYGWPYFRDYGALNNEELLAVKMKLNQLKIIVKSILEQTEKNSQ